MTTLREYVEAVVPDFFDVEIDEYSEINEDGEEIAVVQIRGEHDGETYASEFTDENIEGLPGDIIRDVLLNGVESMLRHASDEEFEEL